MINMFTEEHVRPGRRLPGSIVTPALVDSSSTGFYRML